VPAAVRLLAALPEESHHHDCFLEHLEPLVGQRPAVAEHVLIQVLARADAEKEALGHHRGDRRRGLRDDRRMYADRRAGDTCADADLLGRLRDPAEGGPHEGALALRIDPGVIVIGDHAEVEARLFGKRRLTHELVRRMVLGREREAELHQRAAA
jgi:hypothetical protein